MTIELTPRNIALYRRAISTYEGHDLEIVGDDVRIDGQPATTYTFGLDYYWMMGDNRHRSADSRMWGFVPETHIVGRASFVWFSSKMQPSTARAKSAGTACSKASSDRHSSPLSVSTAALVGLARQGALIDVGATFQKQSLQNRMVIAGPQGRQRITFPVQHAEGEGELLLSDHLLPTQGWRSLKTAYGGSPFFAFFEDELQALWSAYLPKKGEHTKTLHAWCKASIHWVCATCEWAYSRGGRCSPSDGTRLT